jgi:CDP-glucose 4,6-dehydratase
MQDPNFWRDKNVLLTGHTGFKGTWTALWLEGLGARVTGVSLPPPTNPSLFELTGLRNLINSVTGDIRDLGLVKTVLRNSRPDVVLHMAAQPLVLESYTDPITTFETNVLGTANVLESIRETETVRSVVVVTTDKCYENREWLWGYRETDRLGGHDPYSASKACAEMVTASYRNSFFPVAKHGTHGVGLATARAGNVIGGGDFAKDRIIPDCLRAIEGNAAINIRRPGSIRPWQHVLEAIAGYLCLAQKLFENGPDYSEAWNFGPEDSDAQSVSWIVNELRLLSKGRLQTEISDGEMHEAGYLKLDTSKARMRLNWKPKWQLNTALEKIMEWHDAYLTGGSVIELTRNQIRHYSS